MKTQTASRVPLASQARLHGVHAVLVPVYWHYYGPTNFLYFCDIALIFTLIAIWPENALLISMCASASGAAGGLGRRFSRQRRGFLR